MQHQLIRGIEQALGWSGSRELGRDFARGALPEAKVCSRLLTPARLLDLAMRRSLAPHRLQCLVDGTFLHPNRYLTAATARHGHAPMADMERLGELLRVGCTLIMDEINTYDPTLEVACRALQWWSHELVQVNAYLTTGEVAGFQLHWDDHDVIIVQIAGRKSWEVRSFSRPAPMYRDAEPNLDPPHEILWDGVLQAGDVMHIPRGYWHQATREGRGDGYSLHLTFGLTKRTGVHWLSWLADQARQDERFRHDIRSASDTDQTDRRLDVVDAALELVVGSSMSTFLAEREQQAPTARHVATHGLFGLPAEVVCVTTFQPFVERDNEMVIVRAAGKEIRFKARAWPAVQLLLSGRPVSIEKVTAETGVDAAALAEVLLAEGICAEVTEALAAGYADALMPAVG